MKVMGLREAKQSLSVCIEKAQKDRVLITRHGKPAAVVIGVAGQEMEDVILQMDPKFWEMIEERRTNSSTVSIEEVRARYGLRAKRSRKRRS
jgi:prevent-host-death family protein